MAGRGHVHRGTAGIAVHFVEASRADERPGPNRELVGQVCTVR